MSTLRNMLLTICMASTGLAYAKDEVINKKTYKSHELGVMMQAHLADIGNSYNTDIGLIGAQYKKHVTSNYGYRLMAGYGIYNHESAVYKAGSLRDTIYENNATTTINLGIIGGALEAQRQFYKKVYFFAAVELRAGYGKGHVDTSIHKSYEQNSILVNTTQSSTAFPNVSMFYMNLAPTGGIRLQLSHLVLGAEFYPINLTYQNQSNNNNGRRTSFFDLGNAGQRFFVHYRF